MIYDKKKKKKKRQPDSNVVGISYIIDSNQIKSMHGNEMR